MKSAGPSYKNIKIMSTANCYMKKIYFTETLFSDAYFLVRQLVPCECECVLPVQISVEQVTSMRHCH